MQVVLLLVIKHSRGWVPHGRYRHHDIPHLQFNRWLIASQASLRALSNNCTSLSRELMSCLTSRDLTHGQALKLIQLLLHRRVCLSMRSTFSDMIEKKFTFAAWSVIYSVKRRTLVFRSFTSNCIATPNSSCVAAYVVPSERVCSRVLSIRLASSPTSLQMSACSSMILETEENTSCVFLSVFSSTVCTNSSYFWNRLSKVSTFSCTMLNNVCLICSIPRP